MKPAALPLLLLLALAAPPACARLPSPLALVHADAGDRALAERLDAAIARHADFNGSVRVSIGGRVVLDKAYGWADAAHTERVDRRTLFMIASTSKFVTAIAALKLAEDGQLKLSDTVGRWFPDAPADKRDITVAQLLSHTSGIAHNYAADDIADREAAARAIFASPIGGPPGTTFTYTNEGPALAAAIIEKATGEPFHVYVRRKVLVPAGMRDARFWHEVDDRTTPHVARVVPGPIARGRGMNWGQIGASGIWSNADELGALMDALMAGKILSRQSLIELITPRFSVTGQWANYGWFTRKDGPKLLWARGTEDFGHNSALLWWPDRKVILTVVSNSGELDGKAYSRALTDELEPILMAG